VAVHRVGIIMNGVTGRMGTNQHLVRSIVALRAQGGLDLGNGDALYPEPILLGRSGRIRQRPVRAAHLPRQDRAGLFGLTAQRDHGVRFTPRHLVDLLRALGADVDARLLHHLDGQRMHLPRSAPGAPHRGIRRGHRSREAFGHLAARRVVNAQEKHAPRWCGDERGRARALAHGGRAPEWVGDAWTPGKLAEERHARQPGNRFPPCGRTLAPESSPHSHAGRRCWRSISCMSLALRAACPAWQLLKNR